MNKLEWNPLAFARNAGKSATTDAMWDELRRLTSIQHTTVTARMPGPRDESSGVIHGAADGLYPIRQRIILRPNNEGLSRSPRYMEFSPQEEELRFLNKLHATGHGAKRPTQMDILHARLSSRMQPWIDSEIRRRVVYLPMDKVSIARAVAKAKYYL